MRSNEYYSKTRVAIVIVFAIVFSVVLIVLSSTGTMRGASAFNGLDFIPNFDKNFKGVILLSNSKSENKENEDTYSLSNIKYDINTLYLDWSEIEAERSRLEQEAKDKRVALELAMMEQKKKSMSSSYTTVGSPSGVNYDSINPISTLKLVEGSLAIPDISDTSFKGYMCVNMVTSTSSYQWKFLHSGDFQLTTDRNGIIMYDGYYVVAMGSYYTNYKVGSTFRITLDSGISFDVITGDEKADKDTDSNRTYKPKGNDRGEIVEFIISCGEGNTYSSNYTTMSDDNRKLGDLSSLGFQGNVIKVEKLDDYSIVNKLYK